MAFFDTVKFNECNFLLIIKQFLFDFVCLMPTKTINVKKRENNNEIINN